jgi:DNA processing protein
MSPHPPLVRGDLRDELIAIVTILRSDAVSPSKLSGLLDYVGSAVDLLPTSRGGADVAARPLLLEGLTDGALEAAEREVGDWSSMGYDVRSVLDPTYPTNLQALFDKPPLVFVQGHWDDTADSRAVAVVGTRAASTDGCKRAFRLASRLAEAGVTVISGMARGIDTCAHRGALRVHGRTIAVMGTGISRRYPSENAGLADQILTSGGALLSQFFPKQHPTRWTFPVRNVTMSGLAVATVVVEAGATSGAKMQAEAALTRGRAVFLPKSLVEAHDWARRMVEHGYKGAHAILVASADEVIDRLELSAAVGSLVA